MQKFKTVVEPKSKFFDLKLKETFSYRDLIFLFVKRDFISRYKQTILGPLWAIIQPLFTTLINYFTFGYLASFGGGDVVGGNSTVPYFVFFMCASLCWSYVSSTISGTSGTFIANAGIMGKVYYPRLVSPIATVFSNLIQFGIQLAIFLVFWIVYLCLGYYSITPWLIMFPIVTLQMMLMGLGLGLTCSAFTTKYRDLTMLIGFGLSLVGFLSPISYGYSDAATKFPKWLLDVYMVNPFTNIVLMFKQSFFGEGVYTLAWNTMGWYLLSWAFTLLFLLLGILLFNKTERTFMDTI